MEITFGDDESEPSEFRHIYQLDGGTNPQTIVTGRSDRPPISEAAELFEVDESRLSWILTQEQDETGGEPTAAVPCSECHRDIWTVRRKAAEVVHGDLTMTCGRCVEARDDGE